MLASRFFQLAAAGFASILLLTGLLHQHHESLRQSSEVKSMMSHFLQSVAGLDRRFQHQADEIMVCCYSFTSFLFIMRVITISSNHIYLQ
jgi:hypothetical protein